MSDFVNHLYDYRTNWTPLSPSLIKLCLCFKFAGNLDDLSLIWDPDGRDLEIDLTSFQEGIKEWIFDIRQRR